MKDHGHSLAMPKNKHPLPVPVIQSSYISTQNKNTKKNQNKTPHNPRTRLCHHPSSLGAPFGRLLKRRAFGGQRQDGFGGGRGAEGRGWCALRRGCQWHRDLGEWVPGEKALEWKDLRGLDWKKMGDEALFCLKWLTWKNMFFFVCMLKKRILDDAWLISSRSFLGTFVGNSNPLSLLDRLRASPVALAQSTSNTNF